MLLNLYILLLNLNQMSLPSSISALVHKPVAVFGAGVSGQGVAALLRKLDIDWVVYDRRGEQDCIGVFTPEHAYHHDLVVYSPGFAQQHPWRRVAATAGCVVMGEFDFASLFWSADLIAVTGTNGKTTLTEFLTFALRQRGIRAEAVGNIGYPLSGLLASDATAIQCAVCEVSSFQAENLQHFSPDAVLWTNFDEDHLDRYSHLEAYFNAKWVLLERLASPKLVVGTSVAAWAHRFGKRLPDSAEIVDRAAQRDAVPTGCCFDNFPQSENYLIARRYWELLGYDVAELAAAARQFRPPRHRLQRVATMGEVSFWNDSKSTNFAATLAALATFAEPVYWIGGGKKKGGDVATFAKQVAPLVAGAFLVGESSAELQSYLAQSGIFASTFESIEDALESALERITGRAAVVLSPGFSSQDQFLDYAQRGRHFEDAVWQLKQRVNCQIFSPNTQPKRFAPYFKTTESHEII